MSKRPGVLCERLHAWNSRQYLLFIRVVRSRFFLLRRGEEMLSNWKHMLSGNLYENCISTTHEACSSRLLGCPSGSECATQYGYCSQLVTSTSAPSSISSSQASSTTSSPQSISTPKLPTSTSSCIAPGPSLSAAAIAVLPVIEFLYIETDYEPYGDIVKSMCLGMQARNSSGNIFNQDVLTYAGSKDPCYEARRRNAKCKGCCKGK
jgi:hypothetical protein